jgi:hypothetical protein
MHCLFFNLHFQFEYHNEHKRNAADTEQKYMRPIVTEPFETFHDFNQMCDH